MPQLAEIPHSDPLTLTNTRPSPLVQDENVIVVEKGQKADKRQSRKPPPAITPSQLVLISCHIVLYPDSSAGVIRSVPVNSPDRAQLPTQPLKLSSSAKGIPSNWTNEKALPLPKAQQETSEDSGQGTTVKFNAAMSEVRLALLLALSRISNMSLRTGSTCTKDGSRRPSATTYIMTDTFAINQY